MTLKPRHLCHIQSGEMFAITDIANEMALSRIEKVREGNDHDDTEQTVPNSSRSLSDTQGQGLEHPAERTAMIDNNNKNFKVRHKVHAIAGIGNPERFFSSLCDCGFDIITHVFADHHVYTLDDISFDDDYEVVMTEKDAVKCSVFARKIDWYLSVDAIIAEAFIGSLLSKLKSFSI